MIYDTIIINSQVSMLAIIELVWLWCSENQLTSLDISNGNNSNLEVKFRIILI